jgi:hypothetical protein
MFGSPDLFDEADISDSVSYDDPMDSDVDVAAMRDTPDAALIDVLVTWGQMPGNPDQDSATNWSGQLSINRGALVVRRTIRFEGPTDRVMPRDDRQSVRFTSATRPHFDGMVLTLIDPDPTSADPLVLSYDLADGTSYDLPVLALLDGPQSRVVDADGNRITATAHARPVDLCNHGFMRGRWHKVAPHRGIFIGGVANALGEPVGHIRGIYGQRRNGDKVFFGKYINLDGQFRGIFRGTYDDGQYQGRWLTRSGEVGALGGEYREAIPGPAVGGHFLGRWRELSCDGPRPSTN